MVITPRIWCKHMGSFLSSPSTKNFESKLSLKFQISPIKSKTFFHNRKLASVRIVVCLIKTFFTHFDYHYVFVFTVFCYSKQEAADFYQQCVTPYAKKVCISSLNRHFVNEYKIEDFRLYSRLFVIKFSLIFQKKIGQKSHYMFWPFSGQQSERERELYQSWHA